MKRTLPWNEQTDVISDESSSSDVDMDINDRVDGQQLSPNITLDQPTTEMTSEVSRRAEMYQEYMSQVPIPAHHGSVIPFSSWVELGKSIKQLYGQPLHYLTNITLTKWDNLRAASEYEQKPLDMMIHPCKAEATIWLVEEIHRRTTSHHHIAELWLKDRMHHTYVDSIFPKI
ncbi:hypothetical protein MANES_03G175300v8 [Manihot esculenta]|nr:hypothetical protein MANES_03G175300v8 [Manihot esculenta]OAY55722.1 hypothetical protein MANES_03G175300v8 [Manihot esculenta]